MRYWGYCILNSNIRILAEHLDFLELHFYPLATGGYDYSGLAAETANLAVLEAMARECAKPGLPLVIAE